MGQAPSRGTSDPTPPAGSRRRGRLSQLLARSDMAASASDDSTQGAAPPPAISTSRISRRNSLLPFTRLHSTGSEPRLTTYNTGSVRRRLTLSRARSTISGSIPGFLSRPGHNRTRDRMEDSGEDSQLNASLPTSRNTNNDDSGFLNLPSLDMSDDLFNFDDWRMADEGTRRDHAPALEHRRRSSFRSSSNISDRLNALRPDRGLRNMTSTLRRGRRSPIRRAEDQTAMLSRLLSVAAAATAASLMGGDHRAVTDASNIGGQGENGTFESFIQALQSGRIASALRQNGGETMDETGGAGGQNAPLNFFRMFRFGSPNTSTNDRGSRRNSSAGNATTDGNFGDGTDGRMIPIIIVGIRSINPGNGSGTDEQNIPPFLDALSTFPAPSLTSPSETTIDTMLPQPRNGTRFSHRRRASMGGLSNFPSSYDNQRHHRSPDRPRPLSTTSDSITAPRPPPSTPASAGLSAVSTTNNSPLMTRTPSSPTTSSRVPSRRGSFVRASGLEPPSEEEQPPVHQRPARQRRMSESDFTRFGSGSSRRNGVVAPDAPEDAPTEGSRSWIIYVLGGSYPENHPILTTPSLFTDSPTYEDMLLLSALLGPAKPPVASESDVAAAGGLFRITQAGLEVHAVAIDGEERIVLGQDERCLVCLCVYEEQEEARKLVNCGHLYHKDCIDQWLTTGRNSCPLCRGQGVDEKSSESSSPVPSGSESASAATTPTEPPAPSFVA